MQIAYSIVDVLEVPTTNIGDKSWSAIHVSYLIADENASSISSIQHKYFLNF